MKEEDLIRMELNRIRMFAAYLQNQLKAERERVLFFQRKCICISPKQAGLSVQKSLGYGVPFVTRPDAITGAERLDVKDNYNGLFYNSIEELADTIIESYREKEKYRLMSENARHYYLTEASPEIMANVALEAIKYVLN